MCESARSSVSVFSPIRNRDPEPSMAINPNTNVPAVSWPLAFWRILKRLDKSKLNSAGMALRNSLAVALPLSIGIATGHPLIGIAISTGALNVAYSDGRDPYAHRARRMLTWSVLGAVAVFLGSVTGNYHLLAILLATAWALAAGLLVSISSRAADLGLNTLVAVIVYGARGAMSPKGALYAGLLVLGGGLLQTALALLSWPVRRYKPERRAIGGVYLELATQAGQATQDILSAPLKQPSAEVQDTLSALGRDHSTEGERFRLLFDQADRLRFSIYGVSRLRAGLEHEKSGRTTPESDGVEALDQMLRIARELLRSIGNSLLNDDPSAIDPEVLKQLKQLLKRVQSSAGVLSSTFAREFAPAADVLAGQLRVTAQLTEHMTTSGAEDFARRESATPLKLQLSSWLETLRANLDIHSPPFRHAIRLALCVAMGDAIGRSINTGRNYWLAMTVAVVLKPDFATTISRGVLRLCGTFCGLLLATALFHFLPHSAVTQLVLVGVFMFFMRYVGPANYGIFSITISGLIVFLIAATGVEPSEVVFERAVNTAAGGIFALIAYAAWPTWERSQVSDVMAEMIDRTRDYFRAVVKRFESEDEFVKAALDKTRDAWRQARSNAEASVDRLAAEPGTDSARLDCLTSMLASSHAFVRVTMELEAGVIQTGVRTLPGAFQAFAHDVEFTLYFLAAALRGSEAATETLPRLREDHRRLVEACNESSAIDEYVLIETDRLTVSLNTLREQVMRCVALSQTAAAEAVHMTIK